MNPRWVSVVGGGWLFVSSWFLAAMPPGARIGQGLAGAAIFLTAFVAMGLERARRLNTVLGAWMVVAPFVFGLRIGVAGVSELLIGIAVVAASLWRGPRAEAPAHASSP